MGIIASNIVFEGDVPSLAAVEAAVARRTGLRCRIAIHPKHGFIVVKCRELYTDIDMRIEQRVVSIEQPISLSVYFFEQLEGALVDLGGRRCVLGTSTPTARLPTAPVRWRARKWSLRMLDRHPFLTSLVWLAIMLPGALYRRFFAK